MVRSAGASIRNREGGRRLLPGWFIISLALLAGIAASASPAVAQKHRHRWEVFAEGGASLSNESETQALGLAGNPPQLLVTTTTASLRTTGRLFAGVRFWLNGREALEASYSYSPSDPEFTTMCNVVCGTSSYVRSERTSFFAGNYVRVLPSIARLQPFVTAGLGVVVFHDLFNAPHSSSPFAANFGGGFDFRVSRHWAIRAEYRDWVFQFPQVGYEPPGGFTHNSVPTAGLVFRF